MSNSVESFNAASWRSFNAEAPPLENVSGDLQSVSPGSKAWEQLKSTPSLRAPYLSQINESINTIQRFIAQFAAPGAERQNAIKNLNHFLQTRVNCSASNLTALTINENRRNLNLFAKQLGNPSLEPGKKLTAALDMCQGLGVCNEGETLHIQESTQHLCGLQTGFAGALVMAKNQLISQHLQQLVKYEDAPHLSTKQAKELEIHHVQALKNHVASQWGLCVTEDRYATRGYQQQAGAMASELLRQTITPALLANTVAEQIAQSFNSLAEGDLSAGMPAEQLKTEPLRRAIQAEFGSEVDLQDCLDFNDDYTMVSLKPLPEIALHVMKNCQHIGLVHADADPVHLLNKKTPTIGVSIAKVATLRGIVEYHSTPTPFIGNFWVGQIKVGTSSIQTEKDEQAKRERIQQATSRLSNIHI